VDWSLLVSPCDLHARLLANALIRFSRAVIWALLEWQRENRQLRNGRDDPVMELFLLHLRDASDETEVVIAAPGSVAFLPPAAYVAMLHAVRVRIEGPVGLCHASFELCAHKAIVRGIVEDAMRFCGKPLARHDHVQMLGEQSLCALEQVGIQRELQDRACFGVACKLAIVNLV
jgi:hypothetical protein